MVTSAQFHVHVASASGVREPHPLIKKFAARADCAPAAGCLSSHRHVFEGTGHVIYTACDTLISTVAFFGTGMPHYSAHCCYLYLCAVTT